MYVSVRDSASDVLLQNTQYVLSSIGHPDILSIRASGARHTAMFVVRRLKTQTMVGFHTEEHERCFVDLLRKTSIVPDGKSTSRLLQIAYRKSCMRCDAVPRRTLSRCAALTDSLSRT